MADIAVLGAGGWGMALAISATGAGNNVTIWSPFEEEVKMLSEKRTNERLLSGVTLPESIKIIFNTRHGTVARSLYRRYGITQLH